MNGGQESSDAMKNQMRDASNEFMNLPEIKKRIRDMVGQNKSNRFNVSIDEVRHFAPKVSQYITKNPIDAIKLFEDSLNQTVRGMQEDHGKGNSEKQQAQSSDVHFPKKVEIYYVNFEGNFGKNYVTPRGLKANLVNQFVQV
jgi:DNA replicative helicase MCM subunit Mcm2 (Cdc46/Mcm family)